MNKHLGTLFFLFFTCLCGIASYAQREAYQGKYNIAAVSGTQWCDPKSIAVVDKEIDRIVADGFNSISLGTFKFMPMYFVDFSTTKFPDAAVFDKKKIEQNILTLRRNMQRAKSKGIKYIISRSYSHYIPYAFWKSRESTFNPGHIYNRYLETAHQNDLYKSATGGKKGEVIGHQQWSNQVYKEYFISSTYQLMKNLPELDGFLNAYAEAAWTLDESKLKDDNWKNWKDCINYDATNANFIDYVNTIHKILQDTRGNRFFLGIRDWYVNAKILSQLSFPLNEFYIAVKYGGYDQPVINYPPWSDSLKAKGIGVIQDMLVYDAEHPHPLYWYSADFVAGIFANISRAGFQGIQYHDYEIKGDDNASNPVRLLTQHTVGKIMRQEKFGKEDAVRFLKEYYGDGAGALVKSLDAVTLAQATNIKLKPAWFWQGDGLTPGGLGTERYWMFLDNPEAPAGMSFIRQDVVSVNEYANAFIKGQAYLLTAQAQWKAQQRITPMEAMGLMDRYADEAVAAALEAREKAPGNAPHMQELVASAVIHQQLVKRDNAFLQSALAYFISGGQWDGKYNNNQDFLSTGIDRKAECIAELEKEMFYDLLIRELCLRYMPRRRAVRGTRPYDFTRRIASLCGKEIVMAETADKAALQQLEDIIEGKTQHKKDGK